MTVRRIGNATIEKVEEICGPGFKPNRMFPRFDQAAFDAQKGWMLPEHIEAGSDRLVGSVHTWFLVKWDCGEVWCQLHIGAKSSSARAASVKR